jgi:putative ABC transport system permease protein
MSPFGGDVAYAFRTLRKSPGFTLTAVVTLALGIGATTAIFSVVNAVLLRPLPYAQPDHLVRVVQDMRARNVQDFPIAPGDFFDLRERMTTFDGIAAFTTGRQVVMLPGETQPQQITRGAATPSLFKVLGAAIEAGRDFEDADGTPVPIPAPGVGAAAPGGAAMAPQPPPPVPAAILSHEFWQRRCGADGSIVGRIVDLGGPRVQVVGVLAPGFELLLPPGTSTEVAPDVWTAMRTNFAAGSRVNVSLRVVGRLRGGASISQAQSQLDAIGADLRKQFPIKETAGVVFTLTPMSEDLVAEVRPGVLALMGAVVFVLLIACANVANLLLVRAGARERELAVRTALGGSRLRLVRQLLTESVTLALIGGVLGLVLARLGVRLLLFLDPENLPRLGHVAIDPAALGFAALAALVAAVVFGLPPAIRASRPDVIDVLRKTGRTAGLGAGRWLRAVVVVSEVALSFVLLVGAGLMIRSFIALQHTDPGFDPKGVLTFQIPDTRQPQAEGRAAFMRELQARLRALPGVESVTAAFPLPQDGGNTLVRWGTEAALTDPTKFQQAIMHTVLPGYFETMRTRVVDGRAFTDADNVANLHVMVIDSLLAARAFPGQSAVGQKILARLGPDQPEPFDVIGVVRHERHTSFATEGREAFFVTDGFTGSGRASRWAIRTSGEPAALAPLARAEVARIDPRVAVVEVQPMTFYVDRAQAQTRFALILIGIFAVIALVLASVGLYGVLSTTVRQRTAEIGVRMAFGADHGRIFRMMVGQGLRLSAVGLVLGLGAAYLLTGVLRTLLVGVQPTDPLTFVSIAALFLVIGTLASGVPAIRASRLDPIAALREE